MKKTKLLLLVSLMVISMTIGSVYAEEPKASQPEHAKRGESFAKELNLTPEQQSKLSENRKAQREKMVQLRKDIKEKEGKLREALKGSTATKATIEPIANDMKSLQAQLIDNRIDGILAVKQILTPEQAAKFEQMAQKHRQNKGDRFKNYRGRQKCNDQEQ